VKLYQGNPPEAERRYNRTVKEKRGGRKQEGSIRKGRRREEAAGEKPVKDCSFFNSLFG
jgi:hypothetical protein